MRLFANIDNTPLMEMNRLEDIYRGVKLIAEKLSGTGASSQQKEEWELEIFLRVCCTPDSTKQNHALRPEIKNLVKQYASVECSAYANEYKLSQLGYLRPFVEEFIRDQQKNAQSNYVVQQNQ